jgi:hypothetical protein
MKSALDSGRPEHVSILWEELGATGPVKLLEPHSSEWETYRACAISRGEPGVASFMDMQASRGIAWHVRGPIPADHGLVQHIKLNERKKKLGLRIVGAE